MTEMQELQDKNKKLQEEIDILNKVIKYDSVVNDMQAEIDCGERMLANYKFCLQRITERIESYNDCYEGTPDAVIKFISEQVNYCNLMNEKEV